MKKQLLTITAAAFGLTSQAQVLMTNNPPPFGSEFTLSTISATGFTEASAGANQTWSYPTAGVTSIMAYKVVDPSTLPSQIKDSVPDAEFGYQMQGGAPVDQAAYDFFSNENTHYMIVGKKSSGSGDVTREDDTLILFNQAFGTTLTYGGFNRVYDAYGSLTIGTKTYDSVARIKSYVVASTDTLYQFFRFTPYFHRILSYAKMNGNIQNIVYWNLNMSTGLKEQQESGSLCVFPNPARGVVQVRFEQPVSGSTITVRDLSGRIVSTSVHTGSTAGLDVSALAPGLYLLDADAGNGLLRQKLMIR